MDGSTFPPSADPPAPMPFGAGFGAPPGWSGHPGTTGWPPAEDPQAGGADLIYAIGTVGVDFGTEARRDGFREQMSLSDRRAPNGAPAPANPYDPHQLHRYLVANPWASDKVIWTLNLDRTPIYALVAEAPVGMAWEPSLEAGGVTPGPPVSLVHKTFRDALVGQIQEVDRPDFVSRVSVPGVLTGRTVRLFSGQEVPVVEVKARGIHTWNESAFVDAVVDRVRADLPGHDHALKGSLRAYLDKIYYHFRNLGQSPSDRALNYAATNAFMITEELACGPVSGRYMPGTDKGLYTLDTISVARSPYSRMDSDCWDVSVRFFDPHDDERTRVTYLFTIDVSDELPVSLAPAHRFLEK